MVMNNKFTLVLFLATLSILIFNCSNLPKPRNEGESLCILLAENPEYNPNDETWSDTIIFEGPTTVQVNTGSGKWNLSYLRLEPGEYTITKRMINRKEGAVITVDIPLQNNFYIAANSVYLFPIKVIHFLSPENNIISRYAPISPDDQRDVTAVISDYLNFAEWFGSDFVGFGPYKPSFAIAQDAYAYSITSDPGDAVVIIDDEEWGTTPITAVLPPGKHMLQIKKENYVDYSTFIDVQSQGEVNIALSKIDSNAEGRLTIDLDNINILIVPLQNIGDNNFDYLQPVFSDIIKSRLMQEENFIIFDYPSISQSDTIEYNPDFSYAEENGIDLLLYGYFTAEERELLVHASVYDVKSEMVKASIMYTGESGFSMFDSIDMMTEEFLQDITKALPEIGQEVVLEESSVRSQIISYEMKRTENEVIEKRLERKNSISFGANFGKYFFTIDDPPVYTDGSVGNGPGFGLSLSYERTLTKHLSIPFIFNPNINLIGEEKGGSFFLDLPLYFGPRFNFLGYKTELYFSLLGNIRLITSHNATDQESGESGQYGPFFSIGIGVDTGVKIYTYNRISKPPTFFNIGMIISFINGRFTFGNTDTEFVPLDIWIYFSFGSRL